MNYTYDGALQMIKEQRRIAQPNANFETQLRFLENNLTAIDKAWTVMNTEEMDPICNVCKMPVVMENSIFKDDCLYHHSCLINTESSM